MHAHCSPTLACGQTFGACELPVDFEATEEAIQRIKSCSRRSGVAFIQIRRLRLCGPAQREALCEVEAGRWATVLAYFASARSGVMIDSVACLSSGVVGRGSVVSSQPKRLVVGKGVTSSPGRAEGIGGGGAGR